MKTFTEEYTVYNFSELDEDTQQKVLEELCSVNVEHEWWDCTFEDAKQAGIEIESFDCDYRREIQGQLTVSPMDSIEYILANHGVDCGTYNLALRKKDSFSQIDFDSAEWEDEEAYLEQDYENMMLEEYLSILRKEYEYLTSKEAIIETIESNDWTFLKNGKMKNQ